MREIHVRNEIIGSGLPRICVPLMGENEEELLNQAAVAAEHAPDLLEWRADFFTGLVQPENVKHAAEMLREKIGEIPLIFTVRTSREGGNFAGTVEQYGEILQAAGDLSQVDLIDVELYQETTVMKELMRQLQKKGKVVIASNHHFEGTPDQEHLEDILDDMEAAGADIRKLAVMPKTPEDVLALLSATREAAVSGEAPVITMAMGQLGVLSRISGSLTGSAVTFGTTGEASAPGQMAIEELRRILPLLA